MYETRLKIVIIRYLECPWNYEYFGSLEGLHVNFAKDPVDLELAIDPLPRGNFVHYDFLKLHYVIHKIKAVRFLRVSALTCNITLYMLPHEIALNVPDNVSTMTCLYIFAC